MAEKKPYNSWSLQELKAELKRRNAKVSGKKASLIERLEFYEQNIQMSQPDPEYNMVLPLSNCYKDVHSGMKDTFPKLTMKRLEEYLDQHDKRFEDKFKQLYEERFLRNVRLAVENEVFYVTSTVWAEMKKSVSYKVDVSLNMDGVVQEAQCECGAGQGPSAHCKHVSSVLYAVVTFASTGKILTELTCTQRLQTFHHVKPHKGSPIKSDSLHTVTVNSTHLIYDPRQAHFRRLPNKMDTIRNKCINYQIQRPMPVMHLFPPANPMALALDHDYMPLNAVDHFLQSENISHISEKDVEKIEHETCGQNVCKAWRKERQKRITASVFGEICKATSRKDMHGLARKMTSSRILKTAPIIHGRRYESIAVEKYETLKKTKTQECGLFVSAQTPVLGASPDRVVDDRLLVEVKCPYVARDRQISEISVPYLKRDGDELLLDDTHVYHYQIQGQMYCSNREECDLVIYTFKDIKVIKVFRDNDFIESMVDKLMEFYDNYFKNRIVEKLYYRHYNSFDFQ